MSDVITVKGRIARSKPIFENSDTNFKIYAFCPDIDYENDVILNKYGNISIKGILPNLIDGKGYELELEYVSDNKYDSYNVIRILNNINDLTGDEAYTFLSDIISENIAFNILSAYPNFIELVLNEKFDEINLNNIKGVKEKKFNDIVNKINENMRLYDIIIEFKDYDLTINQVKAIYDKYSSIQLLRDKMSENPYKCLCSLAGIGFSTADVKILKKNKSLSTSSFRMNECINYMLKQNEENGHTWITVNELYTECSKLTLECMSNFKEGIVNNIDVYYDDIKKIVALKSSYLCEKEIADRLFEINNNSLVWDIDYNKYNKIDNIELTEQQMQTLKNLCENNVSILAGVGGSGKSFSTKALINMLDENNISYLLLSPTGKASKVLADYTERNASTIHRGLIYNPQEGFLYNENNKLPYQVIIVDESSMIDIFLMRTLLRAIDEKSSKILFICDPAQIPSVGCGNCIQDIINSNKFKIAVLDKVFRYGEGGLSYVATETRKGKYYIKPSDKSWQYFGTNKDFMFIERENDAILNEILKTYQVFIEKKNVDKSDIMILSAYNKGELGTYNINKVIQNYINPNIENKLEMSYIKDKKNNIQITFRVGDKVMQIINDYKAKLYDVNEDVLLEETTTIYNGDDGTVVYIDKYKMLVDFYGNIVYYRKQDINKLLLSYAISMHKSQGSQAKYIIAITPSTHTYFLNRNLLYVAFSRGKEFVCNIGNSDTIKLALRKSENISRKSFLKDLLNFLQ